mmetsp:Transcript_10555/g.17957  ORF Transcript_10555/g.17957 Transcript_10555/m.17957 type:complete len:243 (-) Transcript_10555:320-1048(-)
MRFLLLYVYVESHSLFSHIPTPRAGLIHVVASAGGKALLGLLQLAADVASVRVGAHQVCTVECLEEKDAHLLGRTSPQQPGGRAILRPIAGDHLSGNWIQHLALVVGDARVILAHDRLVLASLQPHDEVPLPVHCERAGREHSVHRLRLAPTLVRPAGRTAARRCGLFHDHRLPRHHEHHPMRRAPHMLVEPALSVDEGSPHRRLGVHPRADLVRHENEARVPLLDHVVKLGFDRREGRLAV